MLRGIYVRTDGVHWSGTSIAHFDAIAVNVECVAIVAGVCGDACVVLVEDL
jgi:hypothetical protein